jgi:hypothetical protein
MEGEDDPTFLMASMPKDVTPKYDARAMHHCIGFNAVRCVRALLAFDPSTVSVRMHTLQPLHTAVCVPSWLSDIEARLEIVALLLAARADVECERDIEGYSHTPLEMLARCCDERYYLYRGDHLRTTWLTQCGELLIDVGNANTSGLPATHPLSAYAKRRLAARQRVREARFALWIALRARTRLPRDVAKLVVATLELKCWRHWE